MHESLPVSTLKFFGFVGLGGSNCGLLVLTSSFKRVLEDSEYGISQIFIILKLIAYTESGDDACASVGGLFDLSSSTVQ